MHQKKLVFYYRYHFLRLVVSLYYHLGEQGFLILLGVVTGLLTGAAAGCMKQSAFSLSQLTPLLQSYGMTPLVWILPAVGLILASLLSMLLLNRHNSLNLGWVIYDLRKQSSSLSWKDTFAHVLTAAITIGLGGSAGLETPSVLTGFAIGGQTGSLCRLSSDKRGTIMVCGSAAGTAAIFSSPIAGALFAMEVVFPQNGRRRLIPILAASVTGAVMGKLIFGGGSMLQMPITSWTLGSLPWYVLLGVISALVGVYLIRVNYHLGRMMMKYLPNRWARLATGCVGLCLLLALFPHLAGNGYHFIQMLLDGSQNELCEAMSSWQGLLSLGLAGIFLKIVATSLTLESGGDGGIFAPTLFVGAFTGFCLVRTANWMLPLDLPEATLIAVGMCGVFTSTLRAPLTGILLIGEMTGDILLMIPLLLVAGVSYFLSAYLDPFSIYTKVLGEHHLISPKTLPKINSNRPVRMVMVKNYTPVHPDTREDELRAMVKTADIPYFPVLDSDSRLLGMVIPQRIRNTRGKTKTASQLMIEPLLTMKPDDDVNEALISFEIYGLDYLAVLDSSRHFLGFVPRSKFPKLAPSSNIVSEKKTIPLVTPSPPVNIPSAPHKEAAEKESATPKKDLETS